ncbi:LacI family transcriptional regulator, partial [Agrobacterium tumefaciens GW4]
MTVAVGVAAATLAATTSAHAVSISEITARGKVKIGVLTGAPPMGMVDEKGNPSGYDVDVANLIGSYLSLPVELVPLTPPARIPALQTGKVDFLVATLAPTGERAKTVMFTQPYSAFNMDIISGKDQKFENL